jgi:hypothetical protein
MFDSATCSAGLRADLAFPERFPREWMYNLAGIVDLSVDYRHPKLWNLLFELKSVDGVLENRCMLDSKAEQARDELLEVLYPDQSYTFLDLECLTTLDRATTLKKVLGKTLGGVQRIKIETFFFRLLCSLRDRREELCEDTIAYCLRKHGLQSQFDRLQLSIETDVRDGFSLPSGWIIPFERGSQVRKTTSQVNQGKLSDLFWHLDCKAQTEAFDRALESLEDSNCPYALFSIAAPCETTQRWLLNRLVAKQLFPQKNPLKIAFGLNRHDMRTDFQEFWNDVAKKIGSRTSKPDDVIKVLCDHDVNQPIVIAVYDLERFKDIQKQLLTEFWGELVQALMTNPRAQDKLRIVLFFVGNTCPMLEVGSLEWNIIPVVEEIPRREFLKWLRSDSLANYWQNQWGADFADKLESELDDPRWRWKDPWLILDNACVRLSPKEGISKISEVWKWAS